MDLAAPVLLVLLMVASPFAYYGWRERQLARQIAKTRDPHEVAAEVDARIAAMKAESEMMKHTRGRW